MSRVGYVNWVSASGWSWVGRSEVGEFGVSLGQVACIGRVRVGVCVACSLGRAGCIGRVRVGMACRLGRAGWLG